MNMYDSLPKEAKDRVDATVKTLEPLTWSDRRQKITALVLKMNPAGSEEAADPELLTRGRTRCGVPWAIMWPGVSNVSGSRNRTIRTRPWFTCCRGILSTSTQPIDTSTLTRKSGPHLR